MGVGCDGNMVMAVVKNVVMVVALVVVMVTWSAMVVVVIKNVVMVVVMAVFMLSWSNDGDGSGENKCMTCMFLS